MEKLKCFFRIEGAYHFEWNDLRALLMLVNVVLIMCNFSVGSIFGLTIASFGLVKDLTTDRHISGILMHLASIILNCYFLFFA